MNPIAIAEKVDHAKILDKPAELVESLATTAADKIGPKAVDLLHGTWLGHPLHAALIDLPIGALATGTILNAVGASDAADASIAIGLLAAVPTAVAGLADWHVSDKKEIKRTGLVHAATNVAALGCYTASLVAKRKGDGKGGKSLSFLGFAVLMVGAYLGGHMTYNLGAGQPQDR